VPRSRDPSRTGIVSVVRVFLGLHFVLVFFVFFLIHRLEFDGVGGDHLEVAAALRARNDLAFIHLVFLNVQIGLAFRTEHHDASAVGIPCYI